MLLALVLCLSEAGNWLWWQPPSAISPADRLGLSLPRIARMSPEGWERYVWTAKDRRKSLETANSLQVYGFALRAANREEGGRAYEPLRRSAFRYGMACIALEDTLAGGGTYRDHAPDNLFVGSEAMLRTLIRHRARKAVRRQTLLGVRRTFERCRALHRAITMLDGWDIPISKLHLYAALALRYERRLRNEAARFGPGLRANVDRFIVSWGRDYLAIRGSDGAIRERAAR